MAVQVKGSDGQTYTWDDNQQSFTLNGQKVDGTLNQQLIKQSNGAVSPKGEVFEKKDAPDGNIFTKSEQQDRIDRTNDLINKANAVNAGAGAIAHGVTGVAQGVGDILAFGTNTKVRTVRDPTAAYDRANAELNREQAGKYQQAEQRDMQIAKGNYRAEADRDAAVSAASQSNQKLNQMSGATGAAGAALAAKTEVAPQFDQHRQRADAAHQSAVGYGADANLEEQAANKNRADADMKDAVVAQVNRKSMDDLKASIPNPKPQKISTIEGTDTKKKEAPPAEQKQEEPAPAQEPEKLVVTPDDYQAAFNKLGGFTTAKPGPRATEQGTQQAYKELSEKFGTDPKTYDSKDRTQWNNAAHKFLQEKRKADKGLSTDKNGNTTTGTYATAGTSQNSFTYEQGADGKMRPVSKGA